MVVKVYLMLLFCACDSKCRMPILTFYYACLACGSKLHDHANGSKTVRPMGGATLHIHNCSSSSHLQT